MFINRNVYRRHLRREIWLSWKLVSTGSKEGWSYIGLSKLYYVDLCSVRQPGLFKLNYVDVQLLNINIVLSTGPRIRRLKNDPQNLLSKVSWNIFYFDKKITSQEGQQGTKVTEVTSYGPLRSFYVYVLV